MKSERAYLALVGTYLWTSIIALPVSWNFATHPAVGPLTVIGWGVGCALGSCISASIAAVLIVVVSGFRAASSGQNGGPLLPQKRVPGLQVWHDHGDGVKDYFDPSILKQGVDHMLWDNRGNVFTATKHPKTNDNVVTVHINGRLEKSADGVRRLVKPSRRLAARDDASVESISASYNYEGTAYDDYGDDDANSDATKIYYDLFTGENHAQLAGPYDCSTLSPINGDDESANISITPQGNGLTTEIEPACGA